MFDNFFQGTVLLFFTKLVAAIHSLKDTVFISEQHLQPWIVYIQCFDRYFYLRCIVISKQHMQSCIWVVPPLFQEATCRDLVFSRVLSFFKISTCNRLYFQRYWLNSPTVAAIDEWPFFYRKRAVAATIFFKFTVFFQNSSNCCKEIS